MSEAAAANRNEITYDYTHVPTIRRFTLSNARTRVIIGPFGSGKSVGCLMDIIRRGHEQKPSPIDGIRYTRWAVVRNCYDDQTEILTERRGWQFFKDLLDGDKVATLQGNELVFQKPDGLYAAPYRGEMIGFESEGVNFLVTPDHKMYVSSRTTRKKLWGEYECKTASEIYGKQTYRVKRNAGAWKGRKPGGCSVAFMEWLGFWFAEGHSADYTHDGYHKLRCVIVQKNNLEYVRGLFESAGIPFTENKRSDDGINFRVRVCEATRPIIKMTLEYGKALTKRVPQWVKDCPPEYIRAFIKGYIAGDGNHSTTVSTEIAMTSSKCLADDLQELALRAGLVANLSKASKRKSMVINGVPTKQNGDHYRVTFLSEKKYAPILLVNPKQTNKLKGWHKQDYDGMVYCVEMPLVPVYVRRKGKAFWCYRTYRQLEDTTMKTVFDWFPPEQYGVHRVADHEYIITEFDGAKIHLIFRALDRPDHVKNLLSLELTGAWINEAREVPRQIWEGLDGRVGRYPMKKHGGATWFGVIMDTNPPDEDNWLYKLVEKEKPHNLCLFKQPGGRSPEAENIPNLPKGYYEDLAIGKTREFVSVYIDGEYGFTVEGTPVYASSFSDSFHVAKTIIEPIRNLNVIAGFDFYRHPACILSQQTYRGQWRILDEFYEANMGIDRFMSTVIDPVLNQKYRNMGVFGSGDPTGTVKSFTDERNAYKVLKEHGLRFVRPAHTNAIMMRIGAIESMLLKMVGPGEPAFLLSPNCVMLRKGFNGGYQYKNGEPLKNDYANPHDALQYAGLFIQNRAGKAEQRKARRPAKRHVPASRAGY